MCLVFETRVETRSYTPDWIYDFEIFNAYGSFDAFYAELMTNMEQEIKTQIMFDLYNRGYIGANVDNFYWHPAEWEHEGAYPLGAVSRLIVKVDFSVYTNELLSYSPIDPATLVLLAKITMTVALVIIAYFAIQAIKDWLISMVQEETVIYEYDEFGNLIKKTVERTPNITSVALMVVGAVVVGLGALVVLPRLFPEGKRERD